MAHSECAVRAGAVTVSTHPIAIQMTRGGIGCQGEDEKSGSGRRRWSNAENKGSSQRRKAEVGKWRPARCLGEYPCGLVGGQ